MSSSPLPRGPEFLPDPTQLEIFHAFRSSLCPKLTTDSDRAFCTDHCLRRYLRARDFKPQESEKMLLATLTWRHQFQPGSITAAHVAGVVGLNTTYISGADLSNRPVIYMKPGASNPYPADQRIKFMVYLMERAISFAPESQGVEKMVWVLDFELFGSRVSDADSKTTSKATLDILQNHYPERLGLALLVNPPFYFNWLWMIISPFIHPVTKSKVKFVSGDSETVRAELLKVISIEQLDSKYGGHNIYTPPADLQALNGAQHQTEENS